MSVPRHRQAEGTPIQAGNLFMKKNVTLCYGLVLAVFSIGYVTMWAFSSVFLLDAGLSNSQIGSLLAIGSLLSVLVQPVIGGLIDRNPKVTSRKFMLVMAGLIVAVGIVIIVLPTKTVLCTILLYGAAIFLMMLAQPFLNSLGMDAINYGYPLNFGVGHSIGSLGYALGSYAFGYVSASVGPKSIPFAFVIAFFILGIPLALYPVRKPEAGKPETGTPVRTEQPRNVAAERNNPFLFLFRYKRFAVILLGLILIYYGHGLINTYALQILEPKGGNSKDMGTAASIAALCELITTFLFSFYMRKIKLHRLLKLSCIFFTLKIFFSYLVTDVISFFLIQGLQMFGWGLLWVGIVYYVNNLVGEHDKAQGQAYAGMAFTIASVLGNLIGGWLIDTFSVNVMLLSGTAVSLAGSIIIWIFVKEQKTVGNAT